MESLFVDTNIVLDFLAKRENFFEEARGLFALADKKAVTLYISALTFANTYYLLSRHYNSVDARKILIGFKTLVEVLPVDNKILELALVSDFKDFEDAVQYYTALENRLDVIITRNKKDFKTSSLSVMTAKEYLT
ncbi:putative nucleic acid-binding protein, contains PIN domain [Bacteroidales bacterium Barb6]|nr:putative nucleic acid-binding protein, contains PIN domain [Bacteroidales bacterium Barb6]